MTAVGLLAGLIILIIVIGRFRTLDRGIRPGAPTGPDRAALSREARKRRKRALKGKRR